MRCYRTVAFLLFLLAASGSRLVSAEETPPAQPSVRARRLSLPARVRWVSQEPAPLPAPALVEPQVGEPVPAIRRGDQVESVPPPAPQPAPGLTLDEAIQLCLLNNPTIRAGLEAIQQAQADWVTASLPPNPEVTVGAALLPLSRPFTVDEPGGPSEFDVGFSYPVDWPATAMAIGA